MTDTPLPESWVVDATAATPTLSDNTGDRERLVQALESALPAPPDPALTRPAMAADLSALRRISRAVRADNGRVRAVVWGTPEALTLVDVVSRNDPEPLFGLAVDLGTTRIVARLVDLATGQSLGQAGRDNPQCAVGPDILTRIHHAADPAGAAELSRLAVSAILDAAAELTASVDGATNRIYNVTVAGNAAMTHLLLGLDPHWMIREPYIPAANRPGTIRATEIGLDFAPTCRLFAFPNVGSYFGGDLIAGILSAGMHESSEVSILVDVGTNAEVVVGGRDWLMACAGAAGPALEGGVGAIGMTAAPGAIDRFRIDPETGGFLFSTIGNQPPRGLCGSGMIDLCAELFLSGMIDLRGRIVPGALKDRHTVVDGTAAVIVVEAESSGTGVDLVITQVEIDSLVRSKAAMYTILRTITNTVGLEFSDLSTFFVAGTFGSFIDPESAIAIGMMPDLSPDTFVSLGNSSLEGATRVLTHPASLAEVDRIAEKITYLELNVNQEFMNRFSAARFLPHTDRSRFPTVARRLESRQGKQS